MRFVALLLAAALASCRPPCDRPLADFCAENRCRPLGELVNLSDGGSCAPADLISVSQCGDFRVVGSSGYTASELYFDADGGLVAVGQASDIIWDCGNDYRSYGPIPSCSITGTQKLCRAP